MFTVRQNAIKSCLTAGGGLALAAASLFITRPAAAATGWHKHVAPATSAATTGSAPSARSSAYYGSAWSVNDLAVGPDNLMRVLWLNTNGTAVVWVVDNSGNLLENNTYGPYAGWGAVRISVGSDEKTRVLWDNSNGTAALWQLARGNQARGGGGLELNLTYGPYAGWTADAVGVGYDNLMRVMWERTDGMVALWQLDTNGGLVVNNSYGPYANWFPQDFAVGSDNLMRVLWDNNDGTASTWVVGAGSQTAGGGAILRNFTFGPFAGWSAGAIAVPYDNYTRLGWQDNSGTVGLWAIDNAGSVNENNTYGPYSNWTAVALAAGSDNKERLAWSNVSGQAALWQLSAGDQRNGGGQVEVNLSFGPY